METKRVNKKTVVKMLEEVLALLSKGDFPKCKKYIDKKIKKYSE